MELSALFERCLNARYQQVENAADFAIEREGNTLYLFFEPSIGAADWKNNLDFPAKPYKRMEQTAWFAHRGFLKVWKSAEGYIAPAVAERSVKKIITAGYSHGAALAVFCHEYTWFHRPDLRAGLEGYGFGCPRVIWGRLPEEIKQRWAGFTVVRNLNDAVTHLPPAVLGYRHVGQMLEIGQKGKYTDIDAHRPENIMTELRLVDDADKQRQSV